jgi:hypothetical protein
MRDEGAHGMKRTCPVTEVESTPLVLPKGKIALGGDGCAFTA